MAETFRCPLRRRMSTQGSTEMMRQAIRLQAVPPGKRRDAWAAMSMIHEAVGLVVPPGSE